MTTSVPIDALSRVPLLENLSRRDLEQLARELKPRTFGEGQLATEQGSTGIGFFIVLEGTATVTVDDAERAPLGPGDFFGEVALFADDRVRTATVRASTDLQCVGLSQWEFKSFLREHPDAGWTIMQTMAARLES